MSLTVKLTPHVSSWLTKNSKLEKLLKVWRPPFELDADQTSVFNTFCDEPRHGYWWKPGRGKTIAAIVHALSLMESGAVTNNIVLLPPIVMLNWFNAINNMTHASPGVKPTCTMYRGSPKERLEKNLDVQFILMSYEIFKRDFERLYDFFRARGRRLMVTADEGHKLKNIETESHKAVKLLAEERPLIQLTGTPISSPFDVFGYCKFNNPNAYRNKRHFEQLHVVATDAYDNVTEWGNLDLLNSNFMTNASFLEKPNRIEGQDNWLPVPMSYELAPAHLKLYNQVAEEQLVELANGAQINAIGAQRLYQTAQQLVLNWAYFAQEPKLRPAGFELIMTVLEELQGEKLMLVANYRMSVALLKDLLQPYGAVAINGDMTYSAQMASVARFTSDDKCQVVVMNPEAGGVGLDGLQEVCSELLFIECPTVPRQFHQPLARLDRTGQRKRVNCRFAVANRTVQVRMHKRLLANDDLVSAVECSSTSLREAIYGG